MSSLTSSPVTQTGKTGRAAAKKVLKEEAEKTALSVTYLLLFSQEVAGLGPKESRRFTGIIDGRSVEYNIGPQEVNEFKKLTIQRIKNFPNAALDLTKSKRRIGAGSGFLAPAQFNQEITSFFSQAELGPIVTSDVDILTLSGSDSRRGKINVSQVNELPNTRLNDLLYFTMPQINGQDNPLYGVLSSAIFTPLFAIHAFYARMPVAGEASRLSASTAMRRYLRGSMVSTINRDVNRLTETYPGRAEEIRVLGERMVRCIDDPNLVVTTMLEIFNPNYFPYAHFAKLISASKVTQSALSGQSTDQWLDSIRARIPNVYAGVTGIPSGAFNAVAVEAEREGHPVPHYEAVVLATQQRHTRLAKVLKTSRNNKIKRDTSNQAKQIQREQQQLMSVTANNPVALQGLSDVGPAGFQTTY